MMLLHRVEQAARAHGAAFKFQFGDRRARVKSSERFCSMQIYREACMCKPSLGEQKGSRGGQRKRKRHQGEKEERRDRGGRTKSKREAE